MDFLAGEILLINKPLQWTSFDVVNKVRYALKRSCGKLKVGHAGTLDPLATGLLIICTGKKTKEIETYQAQKKVYTGTILLGATTPTYDSEMLPDQTFPIDHITPEKMEQARQTFLGEINQFPPNFSALKVGGKVAYKEARKGNTLELVSRKVEIEKFTLDISKFPTIGFEVCCSKGTYIRSLAHDFGKAVGSGGYLSSLCRTQIGDFKLENAWDLEKLIVFLAAEKPMNSTL